MTQITDNAQAINKIGTNRYFGLAIGSVMGFLLATPLSLLTMIVPAFGEALSIRMALLLWIAEVLVILFVGSVVKDAKKDFLAHMSVSNTSVRNLLISSILVGACLGGGMFGCFLMPYTVFSKAISIDPIVLPLVLIGMLAVTVTSLYAWHSLLKYLKSATGLS